MFQCKDFEEAENVLLQDLTVMNNYYTSWRLKLNPSKTELSAFHLKNQLANKKLNIVFEGVELTHNPFPKYLGVTLDRSLTFKEHLTKTCKKLSSRINIVQKLSGISWGANASVLRKSSMNLIYTTAEFFAPVWRNSCHISDVRGFVDFL